MDTLKRQLTTLRKESMIRKQLKRTLQKRQVSLENETTSKANLSLYNELYFNLKEFSYRNIPYFRFIIQKAYHLF